MKKKKSSPDFSVVIAAFNEEKRLPQLLESLKKQRFSGKFEVIVVDNNSTDETAKIARYWGARVLKETIQGIGPPKRKGCQAAKGNYIAIIDADIILPPYWLKVAFDNLQHPAVAGTGGPYLFQNLPRILWPLNGLIHNSFLKILRQLPGGNMAFRKADWEKIGGLPPNLLFGEDTYLASKLAQIGQILPDLRLAAIESGRKMNLKGLFQGNFSLLGHSLKFKLNQNTKELEKIRMKKVD